MQSKRWPLENFSLVSAKTSLLGYNNGVHETNVCLAVGHHHRQTVAKYSVTSAKGILLWDTK